MASTLEDTTTYDTVCGRREKGYVRIRKTERRKMVRQLGLSFIGRAKVETRKWERREKMGLCVHLVTATGARGLFVRKFKAV